MTTARGGYLILDLEHKSMSLGSGHITIPGIYERIEGSYGKPVLISGLVIGNIEQDEAYAMARVESTDYVLRFAGLTLSVNADDEVSIAEQTGGAHVSGVQIAGDKQAATFQQNGAETAVVSVKITWSEESDEGETEVKTKHVQVPMNLGVAGHASATIGFEAHPDTTTSYEGLMVVSVEPVLSGSTATGVRMGVSGVTRDVIEDTISFGKPSFAAYEITTVK